MAAVRLSQIRRRHPRWLGGLLLHALLLVGLVGVIATVQLLGLLALGRLPTDTERTVLVVSAIAAAVAALIYQPLRARLELTANRLVGPRPQAPSEVLRALGAGLSRAVPLDELLLELTESLCGSLELEAAEVWTSSGGLLERTASGPARGWASLVLTPADEAVIARAQVSGPAWLEVWLPALLEGREDSPLRVAPMANGNELLGLVVAERPRAGLPFGELDELVLGEFARQVGLALRNVRLDSQLQASLDEVRRQTEQLRASRARVVSAADAERRRIERDLHDGAQQQLVALCANLRLARELAGTDPAEATALLERLGSDIETALEELRELAHGIYPPLLADRGLAEALSAVAARAPIRTRLEAAALGRYPPQVEATVYFCCLEALQNAGKHAGEAASAAVCVLEKQGGLLFEVTDDGAGFDPAGGAHGSGLTNMTDRLGGIGGSLKIESAPGRGTRVAGTIPLRG
jgi:signal transduction histidine kinase